MGYGRSFTQALRALRAQAGPADESWDTDEDHPVHVLVDAAGCRRALFSPKSHWFRDWIFPDDGDVPEDLLVLARNGPLDVDQTQWIHREVSRTRARLYFAGDLGPDALFMYLALRLGGLDGETSDAPAVDVRYIGVDDAWQALGAQHMLPSWRALPRITMMALTPFQQAQVRWLDAQGVDWDAVVGPASMALLRTGWQLHLEGASNPNFYDAAFPAALRAHLLARMPPGP